MKRIAALLVLLLTAQTAWAAPFDLRLPSPQVHRERWVAIGLGIGSATLLVLGTTLAVQHSGSQTGYTGIGLASLGGAGAMAALYTLTHEAAHDSVLHELDREGTGALDRLDDHARRTEIAGIVTTAVGVAFFAVGAFLTFYSLRDVRIACEGSACDGPRHSDTAVEWPLGIALSVIGDASWLSGSFVWAYGSGLRGGVAEARRSVHASLAGVSGTF